MGVPGAAELAGAETPEAMEDLGVGPMLTEASGGGCNAATISCGDKLAGVEPGTGIGKGS